MIDATETLPRERDGGRKPRPMAQLYVIAGSEPARHILTRTSSVTLGRGGAWAAERSAKDRTLALRFVDSAMSGAHARIARQGGRWRITDLGAKNGTWLNGLRIDEAALDSGDIVEMGRVALLFRDDVAPTRPTVLDLRASMLDGPPGWQTFHGPLAATLDALASVAATTLPVLVTGPPGVGKELVAQGLHTLSGRRGRCVPVNCAAIAESVAEAELFGHAKGGFTGATEHRTGRIRAADRGSLFLDEIGDLRPSTQALLLRALENHEVVPVGGDRPVAVDFRLIAATNVDLARAVDEGRFRADLRSRLGVIRAALPPLSARLEDLGILTSHLLAGQRGDVDLRVSPTAVRALAGHAWPGNIRELAQLLAAAAHTSVDGVIVAHDLPGLEGRAAPRLELDAEQRRHRDELIGQLEALGGNVAELCRHLDVQRQTVYRWFKRYGLDPRRYR